MKKLLPCLILSLLISSLALAHSGRTDSSGGHYSRKTGEYHYHSGSKRRSKSRRPNYSAPTTYRKTSSPTSTDDIPPPKTALIVTQVIDGDTIVIVNNGIETKIRFLGVDTPELGTPEGEACKAHLKELIEGEIVTIEHDNVRDKYERLLGTVYFRGANLSEKMKAFMKSK